MTPRTVFRLCLPVRRALALGSLCLLSGPALADAINIQYDISLLGVPIGSATMSGEVDSAQYSLAIQAKLTGLVGLATGGRGAGTAVGSIRNAKVLPSTFAVTSAAGDDQRTVRMSLPGGSVKSVEILPPLEEKPDRVPVNDTHKRGVLDPIGAMVMPLAAGVSPTDPSACNRTLPVFDGAARFDIKLSFGGVRKIEKDGYRGDVLVCKARYVPIAGHRTERKATKFMAENKDIDVWLAPIGNSGFLAPYRVSIRTMIGTTVLQASRFAVSGAAQPAKDSPTVTGSTPRQQAAQ
jgi:hypothetical protein